jgi:hypothetical protein
LYDSEALLASAIKLFPAVIDRDVIKISNGSLEVSSKSRSILAGSQILD